MTKPSNESAMRKFLQPLVVVTILVGTGFWAQWYISSAPPTPNRPARPELPLPVAVARVEQRDVARDFHALGDLMPQRTAILRSQVAAQVHSVTSLPIGARVRTGESLIELDARDFEIALAEAEAGLKTAERTLVRHQVAARQLAEEIAILEEQWRVAEADVPRKQELVEQKLLIPNQLERAQQEELRLRRSLASTRQQLLTLEQDQEVQAAQVQMREAARDRAQRELDKTHVVASFDGRLAARHVEVGDSVAPQTELARIEDLSRLKVRVAIPSSQIGSLQVDAEAEVHVPDRDVRMPGKVTEIEPLANLTDRTFEVVVEIKNDGDAPLLAGHLARVRIALAPHSNAVVIPESALVYRGQGVSVFQLEPKDQRFRLVPVVVEEVVGEHAVIAEGLATGDTIAIENLDWLFDGALWTAPPETSNREPAARTADRGPAPGSP